MRGQKALDFQGIFEASPDLCLVLSPELKIEAVSNRYLDLTKATRKDLVGHALFDVLSTNPAGSSDDGMRMLRASLDRVIRHRVSDTMPVPHDDMHSPPGEDAGEARYWRVTNVPVCAQDGQLLHIVHVLNEVSELVHLQRWGSEQEERAEQLRQRAERLARETVLRTQDADARGVELSRSNIELEQFAYAASHDLQEPLRMVSSYVQLLARRYQGKLDQDAEDFIGFALDGTKRMQLMIADLLRFSRIGTQGKPFAPTSLDTVLDRVLANLRPEIEKTNASVTRSALPVVMADDVQIGQAFQHLIGNALKFHGDAPPRIHIGYERRGNEHLFSVEDNGIGIEPQYLDRIFVIFRRLHTRDAYPGTGIGLALCKRVVERHHGRIWAEAAPAQGATFYFTIPDREGETS